MRDRKEPRVTRRLLRAGHRDRTPSVYRNVSILPRVSGGNPGYEVRQRHFTCIHKITPERRKGGVD